MQSLEIAPVARFAHSAEVLMLMRQKVWDSCTVMSGSREDQLSLKSMETRWHGYPFDATLVAVGQMSSAVVGYSLEWMIELDRNAVLHWQVVELTVDQ